MGNQEKIKKRVIQAAEETLAQQLYVSPLDVFVRMGSIPPVHVQNWKKGKIPYLEGVIQGNLHKISFAMKCFRKWALAKGLKPSKTVYLARTRGPKKLSNLAKAVTQKLRKLIRLIISRLFFQKRNKQNSRRN